MKKLIIILSVFFYSFVNAQTIDSLLALHGVITPYVHYTIPNIVNGYFNRFGAFVIFNTDSIPQGSTNLWFTNAAARSAISYTGENYLSYSSSTGVFTGSAVNLAGSNVTSTLPLGKGGTGATTLTGILQGNGTSAITGITNSSTTGQVLRVTGASTYAWGALDLANSSAITGARASTLTLQGDTIALVAFQGGGANAGDTSSFTTSSVYGAFFNSLTDTLTITRMQIGLQGTSASVTVTVSWNDTLNVTGSGTTLLVTAGSAATNLYTGTSVTSFDNTKIPPGNWVWCKTSVVTTKPTLMAVTLIGYKSRQQ